MKTVLYILEKNLKSSKSLLSAMEKVSIHSRGDFYDFNIQKVKSDIDEFTLAIKILTDHVNNQKQS